MCRIDSLMKWSYWFQSRFGCSAPGSISQAQDGPPWTQERRFKLSEISLLQVQVPSRSGAVEHLVGTTSGKQWAWDQKTQCMSLCMSAMLFKVLWVYNQSFYHKQVNNHYSNIWSKRIQSASAEMMCFALFKYHMYVFSSFILKWKTFKNHNFYIFSIYHCPML